MYDVAYHVKSLIEDLRDPYRLDFWSQYGRLNKLLPLPAERRINRAFHIYRELRDKQDLEEARGRARQYRKEKEERIAACTGHFPGQWRQVREALRERVCMSCGKVETIDSSG